MSNCANCKHWLRQDRFANVGNCQITLVFFDKAEYETLARPVVSGNFQGRSDWELILQTNADFGCVQWEQREAIERKRKR